MLDCKLYRHRHQRLSIVINSILQTYDEGGLVDLVWDGNLKRQEVGNNMDNNHLTISVLLVSDCLIMISC